MYSIPYQAEIRHKLVQLGFLSRVIEFIRGSEDESAQALGVLVTRVLVAGDQTLKPSFVAYGGMKLVMALHQYKTGLVRDEAEHAPMAFSKGEEGEIYGTS